MVGIDKNVQRGSLFVFVDGLFIDVIIISSFAILEAPCPQSWRRDREEPFMPAKRLSYAGPPCLCKLRGAYYEH